jgi:hypothetical protein
MILGKNQRGKYSIMKPRYQYFFSDYSEDENQAIKNTEVRLTRNEKPGLILLPHTPHTIRTSVRPCESCHDSEISLGLGDPKRNVIVDSESFISILTETGTVPSDFQTKQVITEQGNPIQTTYPNNQARFLNTEEIAAIKNKSDTYKAFRYMDLKDQRFPRLLAREEYPFDQRHKKNENAAKKPKDEEEALFELNENSYLASESEADFSVRKNADDADLTSVEGQEIFSKSDQNYSEMSNQSDTIKEFSPDLFKTPELGKKLNPGNDILIEEPEFKSEDFQ